MRNRRNHIRSILTGLLILLMIAALCGCDFKLPWQKGADPQAAQEAAEFLADIPAWEGYPFCYVNGNRHQFAEDEIWTSTQESLSPLDDLGRCGAADSCIGKDGMPTGPRGDISEIEPTGWHTDTYGFVEGELLFNRCHLIGHQLSGDDAVARNLITGTSYMNRDGMLPFENAVAEYVRSTGNHVMLRVTPVFSEDDLVARGVQMQAVSVEDNGSGLEFNVFCYNVQPGVEIDYSSGDNELSEDSSMLEAYQAGKLYMGINTHGRVPGDSSAKTGEDSPVREYVLNTNTSKFHYPDCESVAEMNAWNRQVTEASREELIRRGFEPCGNCKP